MQINTIIKMRSIQTIHHFKLIVISVFIIPGLLLGQTGKQDSLNSILPGDDFSKVATSIGQFLKLEYGEAGSALGGAYTALAQGPISMAWNPAGIAFSQGPELYVSNTELYAGITSNYLGFTIPLSSGNTLGIVAQ